MRSPALFTLLLFLFCHRIAAQTSTNEIGSYLNQEPPGDTPKLFAPDLVSLKNRYEFGSVFSKNGKEFYYAVEGQRPHIELIRYIGEKWSEPEKLLISDKYGYNDPFLSPDEKRLYFISDQALDGKAGKKDIDIWFVQRQGNGWSGPINAGKNINSAKNEYYISFTSEGTMYFSSNQQAGDVKSNKYDIYYSRFSQEGFQNPVKLDSAINTEYYEADVFVSPNEDYMIYCAERPDGYGRGDLFISFKDEKGKWKKARNMGAAINTPGYEFCPFVTADKKYLFFSRAGEIYWVDATVIDRLR